jgi:hypothetical protein
MERSSDKHGGRLDDAMSHDVASVVRGAPVEARAAEEVLDLVGRLPGDVTFPTVEAVWEALGGRPESRP